MAYGNLDCIGIIRRVDGIGEFNVDLIDIKFGYLEVTLTRKGDNASFVQLIKVFSSNCLTDTQLSSQYGNALSLFSQ